MLIRKLNLKNFRCFKSLTLELDRQVTLIFGVNGAGKSALVRALALALNPLPGVGEAPSPRLSDLRFETTRNGEAYSREHLTKGHVDLRIEDPALRWRIDFSRGEAATFSGRHLDFARSIQRRIEENAPLPLIAIYGAHRAWGDTPAGEIGVGRLPGYAGALDAGRDLSALRAWWRDRDHHREKGGTSPTLDAAERAVQIFCGEGAAPPGYDTDLQDVVVDLPGLGGRFALSELSDGYRGLIGLVVDLASRAALLNPQAGGDLLQTITGVVVIDELDLHLHPQLQGEVLPALRRTFPSLQFIVTTHSPLVLGSAADNQDVLRLGEDHEVTRGLPVEGRSAGEISDDVMGAPPRPRASEEALRRLYAAIDAREFELADQLLADIARRWSEQDPDVTRARAYLDWER